MPDLFRYPVTFLHPCRSGPIKGVTRWSLPRSLPSQVPLPTDRGGHYPEVMVDTKYKGGPLDGEIAYPHRNKFANYRYDNGDSMPSTHGNKLFHHGKAEPNRNYIYLPEFHIYLHGSEFWHWTGVKR